LKAHHYNIIYNTEGVISLSYALEYFVFSHIICTYFSGEELKAKAPSEKPCNLKKLIP